MCLYVFGMSGPSQTSTPTAPTQHQIFEVGVKALIVHEGQLLLLKRRDYHVWEMPGGRINTGETVTQALQRELREELPGNGDFVIGQIAHAHQTDFMLPGDRRLMLLFFKVAISPATLLTSLTSFSSEHEAFAWVTASKLRSMDVPSHVRKAGLQALK